MSSLTKCCSSRLQSGQGLRFFFLIDVVPEQILQVNELPELLEGGIKAYLVIAGAFAGMFVTFCWVNCIAIFQAEYETNQLKEYTTSEVSLITSIECMSYLSAKKKKLIADWLQFSACSLSRR
jgi:hypothetical protein